MKIQPFPLYEFKTDEQNSLKSNMMKLSLTNPSHNDYHSFIINRTPENIEFQMNYRNFLYSSSLT